MKTHLKTVSGRTIPAPVQQTHGPNAKPNVKAATVRANIAIVDAWLLDQAKAEAASKGDDYNLTMLRFMNAKKLTPDDRTVLNEYLFGVESVRL